MTRLAVLGLLLISFSSAQSISMASSNDGAILHFASKLALRGEPVALNPVRIFRHADPPILQVIDIQNRSIAAPFVSDDGLTTAAFTYSPCLGPCPFARPRDVLNLKRDGKDGEPRVRELQVPAQTYAPELIGVYQIDVEIPADWPTGTAYVFCKGASPFASGGYVPIAARR